MSNLPLDDLEFSGDADDDFGPNLGPDERDMDLIDGSWEERHYRGETRSRDWNSIGIGLGLLALIAIVLPLFLVLL